MTKYSELLDEEIGAPPPSTVDVDAIVRRQRGIVRAQRGGVAVAAAAVVATLVTGIAILQQAGGVRGPDVLAQPSSPARNPRAAEATRLTTDLRPVLDALLPGVTYRPYAVDGMPAADALTFVDRDDYFLATAQVIDAQGTGAFQIRSGDLTGVYGDAQCPTDPAPQDVQLSCDLIPVDGVSVMRLTMTRGLFVRYFVYVQRPGDRSVAVEVTNGASNDYQVQRPAPPLTRDQAVSVATLPELVVAL